MLISSCHHVLRMKESFRLEMEQWSTCGRRCFIVCVVLVIYLFQYLSRNGWKVYRTQTFVCNLSMYYSVYFAAKHIAI